MDKKIIYLVIGEDNNDKEKTLKSLELVTRKGDIVLSTFYKKGEQALEAKLINEAIAGVTKKVDEYYICLIPVGGKIPGGKEGLEKIIFPYLTEAGSVYMPLVEQYELVGGKPSFRGFLNATLFNSYQTDERGSLNHSTAIKQIDCTLYFSFIPLTLLKERGFNEEVTYFYQYEWLNHLTNLIEKNTTEEESTIGVYGVCKLAGSFSETEQYKAEDLEVKRELFKKAQTPYLNETKAA